MDRIIFLDIDGVLNDIDDMMNNIGISKRIYNRGYPNLKNDYEQNKKYIGFNFSFEKIQILKQIIVRTNAKIVLISSWRSDLVIDALVDIGLPVIGMTSCINQQRGKEIKEYLRNNECFSFCVLDDEMCDYKEEGLTDYLVKADGYSYSGLTYDEIDKVVEILSYKVNFWEENEKKSLKILCK